MRSSSMHRRDLLRIALGWAALPVAGLPGLPSKLQAESAASTARVTVANGPPEAFTAAKAVEVARSLAGEAYKAPTPVPLDALASAAPEEIAAIRYRPAELVWAGETLP